MDKNPSQKNEIILKYYLALASEDKLVRIDGQGLRPAKTAWAGLATGLRKKISTSFGKKDEGK
jgi:hypothetical protein